MAMSYRNVVYLPERGLLFAYVPKVACSNWKAILRYLAGAPNWQDVTAAHDRTRCGMTYPDVDGADAALMQDPGLRKFAMTRDPYSRILSAYLNKVEQRLPTMADGQDHFHRILREIEAFRTSALDQAQYPQIDFEVFLLWLRDSGSYFVGDEHWASQAKLLRLPEQDYDMLGRFENLNKDAPRMLAAMGCDQPFPGIGFGPPATGAAQKMARYYTSRCTRLVNTLYAQDIALLSPSGEMGPKQGTQFDRDKGTQAE